MTIDAAYDRWAENYDVDRNLTRDLDQWVTAQLLGDRRYDTVIEAGCGTGKNTSLFAGVSRRVVAMDFSTGMLEKAARVLSAAHVEFRHADLTHHWPCDGGTADLVSCNLVQEHIQDIDHVFREAARVLVAGGTFFVSELHPFRQYRGSQARFVDNSGDTVRIEAHIHHISDFLRSAKNAGFEMFRLDEWWHDEDAGQAPRLLTMLLRKYCNRS